MAIPKFNNHGCLPVGVYRCTLAEVQKRFGSFQQSDRRVQVFGNLTAYIEQARLIGLVRALVIDGSFVTDDPKPNDIDLIVAVGREINFALEDVLPSDYNVLSKRQVRKNFGFDVFVDLDGSVAYKQHLRFFQRVRDETYRKGVLRIEL
jgi:hypothetical protein